jgi:hypothetical protein
MSGGGCQNSNASSQDIAPTAKFGEQVGTGALVRWKQSKRWRFYYFAITFQLAIPPEKHPWSSFGAAVCSTSRNFAFSLGTAVGPSSETRNFLMLFANLVISEPL